MPWKTGQSNPALGLAQVQSVAAQIDTVAMNPIGTIAQYLEDTQGPGELIYLPGVAALAAGDLVAYDLIPGAPVTTRLTAAIGANSGRPVAVALAPVLAGQFGWFQIGGVGIVNIAGAGVVGPLFATATAGSGSSTTTAGSQLEGARIVTAVGTPAAGKAYANLARPTLQSQIT